MDIPRQYVRVPVYNVLQVGLSLIILFTFNNFFKQPKQHCREQARSNRGHEACPSGIRSLMYFFLIFNNLKIRKFVPTSFFSCHFTLKNHASCLFGFVRNIKQKLRILWHCITEIKWKNHSVVKLLVNEILLNFDYYQKSCQRKQFNL